MLPRTEAPLPRLRAMRAADLSAVVAIEDVVQAFGWCKRAFVESLTAGHVCRVLTVRGKVQGYGILALGGGEAELLNLGIDPAWQHCGYGGLLLNTLLAVATAAGAAATFLEVRRSNQPAIVLYRRAGFTVVGHRARYYRVPGGHEDALVMRRPQALARAATRGRSGAA